MKIKDIYFTLTLIGTRVIALFDGSTLSRSNKEVVAPNAFYPGIIAEQLQAYNKYR